MTPPTRTATKGWRQPDAPTPLATPELPTADSRIMAIAAESEADALDSFAAESAPRIRKTVTQPARPPKVAWGVAALFALVALAESGWIARMELARTAAPPPPPVSPPVPVVVDSPQAGDAVIVDGQQVGVTPLTLTLSPGMRSIQVRTRPAAAPTAQTSPAASRPAENASNAVAAALAQAASRQPRGGLRLTSPIEIQVLEGERVLGSSADGPVVTTAGRHELDFVNSALGYRSHQIVDIQAGQIVPMRISPPDGRVSVNAQPWAQVSIDGKPVGETPLANLPLPVGEHEIVFRHPQLGEQTQKVIVKSGALTRVSATLAR